MSMTSKERVFLDHSLEESLGDLFERDQQAAIERIGASLVSLCYMFGLSPEIPSEYRIILVMDIIKQHARISSKELIEAFRMLAAGELEIKNDMRFVKSLRLDVIHETLNEYKRVRALVLNSLNTRHMKEQESLLESAQTSESASFESAKRTICTLYEIFLENPDSYSVDLYVMHKQAYYFLERIGLIEIDSQTKNEIKNKCVPKIKLAHERKYGRHRDDYKSQYEARLTTAMLSLAMLYAFRAWQAQGHTIEDIKQFLDKQNIELWLKD